MFETEERIDLRHVQASKTREVWCMLDKNAIVAFWAIMPCGDRVDSFTEHPP